MQLTVDHLRQIARARSVNDNMRSIVAGFDMFGVRAGLTRPHRLAHYLPQIAHESGRFQYDREIWGPTAAQARYDTRTDLGNTAARDGDGKKYMGRTGMQITGKANTRAFRDWCAEMGLNPPDFVAHPELMNTDPWEGLGPIWYWHTRGLNKYADRNDPEMITRRINGGLNGYADRLGLYSISALVLLGRPVTVKLFKSSLEQFQTEAKAAGQYNGEIDGIDGPKTRAALHMTLFAIEATTESGSVTPGPVVQEIEKPKPVTPEGADKTAGLRLTGAVAAASPVIGFFGDFDQTGKLIVAGVGLLAVAFLLWRGERIAARVKAVAKAFGGD